MEQYQLSTISFLLRHPRNLSCYVGSYFRYVVLSSDYFMQRAIAKEKSTTQAAQ
jgi:hypothetical protein